MKINVDLGQLWGTVKQMGAAPVEFTLGETWVDSELEFDTVLSTKGLEIKLEDLVPEQGLLSVKGRQVLLFIPDHGSNIEMALADASQGKKFHVAYCKTLEDMTKRNRFERYTVTNNLSGVFDIFGKTSYGMDIEGKARLHVCKNCLNQLNYLGAAQSTAANRQLIVNNFDIEEFFSTYSSIFKHLPKRKPENGERGYSTDWDKISVKIRQDARYCCQSCLVDLSAHKNLLHVHHKNGVKHDNDPSNLVALCIDCHKKQPQHEHLWVTHSQTQTINELRRKQNLNQEVNWNNAIKHADTALKWLLEYCQKQGIAAPEVAYTVHEGNSKVICDVAWPKLKIGIALENAKAMPGWQIMGLDNALVHFGLKSNDPGPQSRGKYR